MSHKHKYQIEGMTCNGCRSHVETALKKAPGVLNASVNLERKEAEIVSEHPISLEVLEAALADTGYKIVPFKEEKEERESVIKEKYSVEGMTCNGCRSHVEHAIGDVEDVVHASVDLAKKEALVESLIPIPIEKLAASLSGSRYTILPFTENNEKEKGMVLKKKEKGNGVFYCPMHCEGDKTYDHRGACPVCGMDLVEEPMATLSSKETFYTCPMHPEIVQDHPGNCPICGMDLVPESQNRKEENKTYQELLKKFRIAVGFTLPIFIIAMSEMIPNNPLFKILDLKYWNWIALALSLPVIFYATWMFFERAWRSIVSRHLNMFTLIGIGAGVAWLFSVVALLFPDLFPDQFKSHQGTVHVYFEAATVILTLVLLGQLLEARAHGKTNAAIKALLDLAPNNAFRMEHGLEKVVAIDEIKRGDILRVKPGGKIPVDGTIQEGESHIDESMITGEPLPIRKTAGDSVQSGTLNGNQTFLMKAEKVGSETLLSQIIEMVHQASISKAPVQKLADKISGYFVPIVILISVITFAIWAVWGPAPSQVFALVNAIAVLIIACPCALGLATPMSVKVGMGKGAQSGILIKNAEALEKMNKVDIVVVDKTGTLTDGKPSVEKIVSIQEGLSENEILKKIISLNANSEHPLAHATLEYGKVRGIETTKVFEFKAINGGGVVGKIGTSSLALGNRKLMEEFQIPIPESLFHSVEAEQKKGKTISYLAEGAEMLGYVVISDKIKVDAKEAIQQLQQEGVAVWMLTGDHENTAKAVSDALGLDGFKAGLLPGDKLKAIQNLQKQGRKVAMAGDGINDAPALSQADVGIAMGTGTDIAIESAEITLVKGDLRGIARARRLSEHTMKNIRQNLWFALGYNVLGIPIAAGILYPFFGLLLSPMIAALAMSFSSVSVITNALRLRRMKI